MKRAFLALSLTLSLVFISGCTRDNLFARTIDSPASVPKEVPVFYGLPLKSGQIVVTESPDNTSWMFLLIPDKYYPFTHGGVIAIEDGKPYVYDTSGAVKFLPLDSRVLDNVSGKARRTPFYDYVSPNLYAEVYDLPAGVDASKVVSFVRKQYENGTEFDAFFNFDDHSKLFCTEMIELALRAGGDKPRELEQSNPNPSIVEGMKWLAVKPGVAALPAARFIEPSRYVGAMGRFNNRAAAYAYFEAKREVFRRFTMNQRLGYLFSLNGNGTFELRPHLALYADRALHLFENDENPPPIGDPRIAQAVRELADEMFGPFLPEPTKELPAVAKPTAAK